MASAVTTLQSIPQKNCSGNCEDVDKMLMVIVKRRKTIPAKCIEMNKEISAYELLRLLVPWGGLSYPQENAKVVTEEYKEKEKFRNMIQGFKRLKFFHFKLDDMNEAEQKLEKHYNRMKEINCYLEKRRKLLN